jgi:uncharacterized protein DUF4118
MAVRREVQGLVGAAAPLVVALIALPLRDVLSPANVAVVLVGVAAFGGSRGPGPTPLLAGCVAAMSFAVLWSRPYGSIEVHQPRDRLTAVLVFAVGAGLGWWGRQRRSRWSRRPRPPRRVPRRARQDGVAEHLGTLRRVAGEIAEGDVGGLVALDVARGLVDVLRLSDCRFEVPPLDDDATRHMPVLRRGGELELSGVRWDPCRVGLPAEGFTVPIVARGRAEGRYVCVPRRRRRPTEEEIGVAVALADQAASALLLDSVA